MGSLTVIARHYAFDLFVHMTYLPTGMFYAVVRLLPAPTAAERQQLSPRDSVNGGAVVIELHRLPVDYQISSSS